MNTRPKYSLEVRERTVRMVLDHQAEHESQWAAIVSIAGKIGCTPESLPDSRTILVICPKSKSAWVEAARGEFRLMRFICSKTAQRFTALMGRVYEEGPYRVVRIVPKDVSLSADGLKAHSP